MTEFNKAEIVAAHARGTADTGSPEVQVALPTGRPWSSSSRPVTRNALCAKAREIFCLTPKCSRAVSLAAVPLGVPTPAVATLKPAGPVPGPGNAPREPWDESTAPVAALVANAEPSLSPALTRSRRVWPTSLGAGV